MKKIVVVEDRPWFTMDATLELQKEGVEFYKMIYYPSELLNSKERNKLLKTYEEETRVDVLTVNSQREFIDAMDGMYEQKDIVFLMDYDLKGDMAVDDFFSRINIRYALEKRKCQSEERIWFYTTGGADVKRVLYENFEERVISTPQFINSQLKWDKEQIMRIVRNYG